MFATSLPIAHAVFRAPDQCTEGPIEYYLTFSHSHDKMNISSFLLLNYQTNVASEVSGFKKTGFLEHTFFFVFIFSIILLILFFFNHFWSEIFAPFHNSADAISAGEWSFLRTDQLSLLWVISKTSNKSRFIRDNATPSCHFLTH